MPDLKDGDSVEVQGSGVKPYVLKNVGGVYSCSCPAWRNQSHPIEKRTCKHLRNLRGDELERERVGNELPKRANKQNDTDTPPLLLAHTWDSSMDLKGWWMSEKLDGVRAYWDGTQLLSRQGNIYYAPDWFTKGFPNIALDGELWFDRGLFQRTVSIVRRQDKSDHWQDIRYLVFDAPSIKGSFEDRYTQLQEKLHPLTKKIPHIRVLEHIPCRSNDHLKSELEKVEKLGGEGLMLRQPGSNYEVGRSMTLLKVKNFLDQEATVIAYQAGKGKHKGRLGALEVKLADGTRFKIGTGLSDKERACPPELGSVVTFRYQELSKDGVPRFPSYLRLFEGHCRPYDSQTTAPQQANAPAELKTTTETPPGSSGRRYFEFSDDKSNKFWEAGITDSDVTVRYGRIGTQGTAKTKTYATTEAAQNQLDKLIAQKLNKGYEEC